MYRHFFKRFFDFLFSLIALPFFAVIFIIIAPIIYFTDKGSPFYNAERLGKNGKIFKMYKFRSMRVNAPDIRNEDGSTYNGEDDHRLTRIGKFIRKTSIDELPQILNVLLSDMSFIGPRPDLVEGLNYYSKDEKRKLEVRPGITGYSQAYFRNSIDVANKLKNDIFYIEKISILLDIKILLRTILSVMVRKNVFVETENEGVTM